MTQSLPRRPASVTRARHVLTTLLTLTDAGEECRGQLAVLIAEACGNAVAHADRDSTVDITIVIVDTECRLEVANRGGHVDGAGLVGGLPDPLAVGGRGLPLIAALADTATIVTAQPGRVRLRMTKRLAA